MKTYPAESWMSPKLITRKSLVHGGGVFAVEPIKKGEVLVRWGGEVYTTQQVINGETSEQSACQVDDDLFIAYPPNTPFVDSDLMNHSCDPNTWMDDEITLSASRDIQIDEEVTSDYALSITHPGYIAIPDCHCGSPLCRHRITGDDWKIPEVQERYRGHFPPYLERRIASKKSL